MKRRLQQIDESIERYLGQLASADRQESSEDKSQRLEDKIARLKQEMVRLKKLEVRMLEAPDQQISLTDPDARSMATSGRGTGMVGYNVQTAVDTTHHLIVAHEVTNVGHDRTQLANMAQQAKAMMETEELEVVADRGYFQRAKRSWPVMRRGSRPICRSHRPRAAWPKAAIRKRDFTLPTGRR